MENPSAPEHPPLGDAQRWGNISMTGLERLPPGSVAALVAALNRVAYMGDASVYAWDVVAVLMGDIRVTWLDTHRRDRAIDSRSEHEVNNLWEKTNQGYGLGDFVPTKNLVSFYTKSYWVRPVGVEDSLRGRFGFAGKSSGEMLEASLRHGRRQAARYLLKGVVLTQPRFVLAAINDGYPSLYLAASSNVQGHSDVQMAAGVRGVAPAAVAALRSLLLATGAEEPGLIRRFVSYMTSNAPVKLQALTSITVSDALEEAAAALARGNKENEQVQELAQRLSGFLNRPEGKLRERDLKNFLAEAGLQEPDFGWDANQHRHAQAKLDDARDSASNKAGMERTLALEDEGEGALEPGSKRHKKATDSLVSYFGRAKVERMQLFVHAVRVASA